MTAAARADSTVGNNLELNKGDNFIFCVDVSGSMGTKDCPGGQSRIEHLKENVITFAKEASKWDSDGIDVLTFGHAVNVHKGVTAEKAEELIRGFKANEGSTDTAGVIAKAWDLHKSGGYEQSVCFVATDGEPNDRAKVMETIRGIAGQVKDAREFAISFLTVGNIDAALRSFLTELDDSLNAKHDIVDVKALTEVDFMAAFAGAIND
jgi:Mg-chelatase subunit ChlD